MPGRSAEGPRYPGLSCPPPQGAGKKLVKTLRQIHTANNLATSLTNRKCDKIVAQKSLRQTKKNKDRPHCGHRRRLLLVIFFGAQEFVALDGGDDADGAFVASFGALHATEATYPDRTSHGDLVGECQQDFDRRAFFNYLRKEKIHATRADIAGFRAGFTHGCPSRPPDGKR